MALQKKIILLVLIICGTFHAVQARNPYRFIHSSAAGSSRNLFIIKAYQPAPLKNLLLNSPHPVKPFKSFAAFMAWDFKLKIKLSNNMNFVFSYN